MQGSDGGLRVELQGSLSGHLHLGPAHMVLPEEELAVQVTHLNGVQVNLGAGEVGGLRGGGGRERGKGEGRGGEKIM